MHKRGIYALLAATLTAAGCGEITGFLNSPDSGALSLRYAGAEAGSFSARGVRPHDWNNRTHAAGQRLDSPAFVKVFAYALGRRGLADHFFLYGTVVAPGTYPFAAVHGADGTIHAELALDASNATNTARAIYVLTSGSVTLESGRDGRIRGRFAGTARLLNGTEIIHITHGRFDVPNNLPPPVE